MGDALQRAYKLKRIGDSEATEDEDYAYFSHVPVQTEESIVHDAVGILRKRIIAHTPRLENEYYSYEEMKLTAQKEFVDPLLYKAVRWLVDSDLYNSANNPVEINAKCLNICCDIVTAVTSVWSPKHIGLAVHLHHNFGSRILIEDIYS